MSDCPIVRGLKGTRVTVLMDGTTKIRPQLVEDTVELIERLRAELAAARNEHENLILMWRNETAEIEKALTVVEAERDALRAQLNDADEMLRNQARTIKSYQDAVLNKGGSNE